MYSCTHSLARPDNELGPILPLGTAASGVKRQSPHPLQRWWVAQINKHKINRKSPEKRSWATGREQLWGRGRRGGDSAATLGGGVSPISSPSSCVQNGTSRFSLLTLFLTESLQSQMATLSTVPTCWSQQPRLPLGPFSPHCSHALASPASCTPRVS